MELFNETPYGAGFVNTVMAEDQLLAAVLCKPVYEIADGRLIPNDAAEPWPVGPSKVETEFGDLDGDMPFPRGGIDLIYMGSVYAPGGDPVSQLRVTVEVGEVLRRSFLVFGDRHWERRNGSLVPSTPVPFEQMPFTYERAYGGECEVETGSLGFPANPEGRGFYMEEWQAEGEPLPNIEDPDDSVAEWSDQPDPVGTAPYPLPWALRLGGAVEIDDSGDGPPDIDRVDPVLWNNAHPQMVIDRPVRSGDTVRISHARPGGDALEFELPDHPLHVHVQLEHRHRILPLHLDQIVILGDEGQAVLTYRVGFTYTVVAEERRAATVRSGSPPDELPRDYPIRFDAFDRWPP